MFILLAGEHGKVTLCVKVSSEIKLNQTVKTGIKFLKEVFLFFSSFSYIVLKKFIKRKHFKLSLSASINVFAEFDLTVLRNLSMLFMHPNSGSQCGPRFTDVELVACIYTYTV